MYVNVVVLDDNERPASVWQCSSVMHTLKCCLLIEDLRPNASFKTPRIISKEVIMPLISSKIFKD